MAWIKYIILLGKMVYYAMNSKERSFLGKMKKAVPKKTYEKIEQVLKKPPKSKAKKK